jgi:quinol monooxygenase YgiN
VIAVLGSFRFPVEALEQARPLMRAVIEATLAETGCQAYSYAEDVAEPGLLRVMEQWDSREALSATPDAAHEGLGRAACGARILRPEDRASRDRGGGRAPGCSGRRATQTTVCHPVR